MTYYPPKGLIVALVTPFEEKGGIDWESNRRLIERVLPFCGSLLIGEGLIGEGRSLPNPVRLDLLRGSVEATSGKKPLFLCPTSGTMEETLNNVQDLSRVFLNFPGKES